MKSLSQGFCGKKIHVHSVSKKPRNPVFRDYFLNKVAEGKSKPQALTSITRKLIRVLYGMMKNKSEYQMPELLDSSADVAEIEEDLLDGLDEKR